MEDIKLCEEQMKVLNLKNVCMLKKNMLVSLARDMGEEKKW